MADILVIEDDQRIRELVCRHLAGDGYGVTSEGTGLDGLRTLTADPPDALVLDLGLPDLDGLDLLKMVRAVSELPVLVLTAREDETSILAAFAGGADDYVVKPISGPQLSARIAALLRRGPNETGDSLTVGDLEIHLGLAGPPLRATPWNSQPRSSTCWPTWLPAPAPSSPKMNSTQPSGRLQPAPEAAPLTCTSQPSERNWANGLKTRTATSTP